MSSMKKIGKYLYMITNNNNIKYRVVYRFNNSLTSKRFDALKEAIKFRDAHLEESKKKVKKLSKDNKNGIIFLEYPFNLIHDILDKKDIDEFKNQFMKKLNEIKEKCITEEEYQIIKLYYDEKLSLRTIGKKLKLSYESIRMKKNNIANRLKERIIDEFMPTLSTNNQETIKEVHDIYIKKYENLWNYESAKEFIKEYEGNKISKNTDFITKTLNLSSRVIRSLTNSGYYTLEDVSKLSYDQIASIKGLGDKSINQLIAKLNSIGIYIDGQEKAIDKTYLFNNKYSKEKLWKAK